MAIYEIDVKNFSKLKNLMNSLNTTFDTLEKVNKKVKDVGDSGKKVKKTNEAFKNFNGQLSKANKNITSMLGLDTIMDKFAKIKDFGVGLFKALTSGALSFFKTISMIFAKFALIMVVLTALTSIMQIFKNAFKFNIGGIQGTFRKLQARFKQLGATLQMLFFNNLQKLAPVFEQIGKALGEVMDVLMSPEVLSAFMAISDVFVNLMKVILPALIGLVKILANLLKFMAGLINKVAGVFSGGKKSGDTTNTNSTVNNNNYYTSTSAAQYGQGNAILEQMNSTP